MTHDDSDTVVEVLPPDSDDGGALRLRATYEGIPDRDVSLPLGEDRAFWRGVFTNTAQGVSLVSISASTGVSFLELHTVYYSERMRELRESADGARAYREVDQASEIVRRALHEDLPKGAATLAVNHMQWVASRLDPKRWGKPSSGPSVVIAQNLGGSHDVSWDLNNKKQEVLEDE